MVATTTGKTLSRDYKHVRRHTPGTPAFNGWVGLGVGLAIGLSVALGVYLHFQNKVPAVPLPDADAPPASAKGTEEAPASSAAPADAGTGQDELTFFDLLKTQEVEVPANSAQPNPSRRPPMERDITLQAGSFKQMAEAEKLQARLAEYGVQATIQRYAVEDETWFRVRIGPIATVEELDHVRTKLAEAEIEAMPVTAPTLEPPP